MPNINDIKTELPPANLLDGTFNDFSSSDLTSADSIETKLISKDSTKNTTANTEIPSKERDSATELKDKQDAEKKVEPKQEDNLEKKIDKTNVELETKVKAEADKKLEKTSIFDKHLKDNAKAKDPQEKIKEQLQDIDLAGFDDKQKDVLLNMKKENRPLVAELLRNKDKTYLQHPDAYVLHPSYREQSLNQMFADTAAQIFAKQLTTCKSGKAFNEFTGFDNNGSPVFGNEIQPNDVVEENLRRNYSLALGASTEAKNKLSSLKKDFSACVTNDLRQIQEFRAKIYPWVSDESYLDKSLELPEGGSSTVRQIRDNVKSYIPAYMRNALADVVADMFVNSIIQQAEIRDANTKTTTANVKTSEIKRGEPSTTANRISNSTNGEVTVFRDMDF